MKRYAYEVRAEGKAESMAVGESKGVLRVIKNLMQSASINAYSAMNMLQIPANERSRYLSALS